MSEARQIQSMIDFIDREALEKAEELDAAAQEEYDVERMRLVEAEKEKIRELAEKRHKQVDVDRRVARANYGKAQRLRVMQEQARILDELRAKTHERIAALVADQAAYKPLLEGLVRQSLASLRTDAVLQCRREDAAAVKRAAQEAAAWYKQQTGTAITVQTSEDFLSSEDAWGGVIATSTDGRIVCNNTLAYRAHNCLEEQLPTVRYHLFNPESSA